MPTSRSTRSRTQGRDGYQFFDAEHDAGPRGAPQLELELRSALERGQLELHYQPQVALGSRG